MPTKYLFSLLVALLSVARVEASSDYPNIIFILADDAGYNDFGWSGDDYKGLTDTLEALKDDGIEITQYYTQQLCTPARASLMTGRYPFTMGMQADAIAYRSQWGLPVEYSILPQYLAEYGYESHGAGKWHLGHSYEKYLPHHRGFLSFYGYLSASEHYRTHLSQGSKKYLDFIELWSSDDSDYVDHTGNAATKGAKCITDEQGVQSSSLYTDRMISIAHQWSASGKKEAGVPLFLYAAYQNPHSPIEPDPNADYSSVQEILDKLNDTARYGNAQLMYELDQEVKRLLIGLENAGVLDNYILVFASDNGPCKISGGSPYPLRGWKRYTYEGGSRTRAFIKGSMFGSSAANSKYTNLFHVVDWLPTLMDAVSPGWSMSDAASELDGVSHWRAFITSNYELNPRREIIYNLQKSSYYDDNYYLFGAIRVGKWKLVLNEKCQLWLDFNKRFEDAVYQSQCEDSKMSCIVKSAHRTSLYNLEDDPSEIYNVLSDNYDHYIALLRRLKEHEAGIKIPISDRGDASWSTFNHAYDKAGCIVPFMD